MLNACSQSLSFFHAWLFLDYEANVLIYEQLAEGYDGRELVNRLQRFLPAGSEVLELGMGPGKDLEMLRETFKVSNIMSGGQLPSNFLDNCFEPSDFKKSI